ncbi:hypothetical protein O0I10_003666 [Lichtheimia ornata]|uniref:Uncharacterized protein n=1 Tax=Lichtheimia ornata TaxID=688661 RepID=A0AAD7V761_9FUNG|nr:uncharacterized protein O0I10_003666 [Lichtheimia ornata]KAJ8660618.1 hypothetical protein O0I10_003666 [Lichtheimia ornata]
MEILKQDFVRSLPEIKKALLEADCISIDAEFTGLMTSGHHFQHSDDMNDRYRKMRQAAKEFSIIQYGVCAFKKVDDRHYTAKPFNFFIFGGDTEGMSSQRTFLSNASSLQFLREHKFDFNKLIDGGIPFYNYSETGIESKGYRGTTRTVINRQNHIDLESLTKPQKKFLQTTRSNIDHWLQHGKARSPLLVQTNNSFIRRLLHQELQHPRYNGFLMAKSRDTKHMQIFKLSAEEKRDKTRRVYIKNELNFRVIIELIKSAECPIIVHNGVLDLCHTVDQFWQYLPEHLHEFKEIVTDMWSNIVDTKYMAEFHPRLKRCFDTTALLPLYNTIHDEMMASDIRIEMAPGYDRYTHDGESPQHEAGFDAYMTGTIYLGFVRYIHESEAKDNKEKKEKTEDKEAVEENKNPFLASTLIPYYNRLYQMRSDYPYLDLTGPEPTPVYELPNRLYLTGIPSGMQDMSIEALYPKLVPLDIHWVNSNNAWIVVKYDSNLPHVKEGKLGEEAIKHFLKGGEHEDAGSLLHITPEAANMELLSYGKWRTDPRFQSKAPANDSSPVINAENATENADTTSTEVPEATTCTSDIE